MTSAALGI